MKKFWLVTLLFAFFAATSFAQGKTDVEFGIFVGPNWSSAANEDFAFDTSYSFSTGTTMEYYFSENWGLKLGLIYDRKGWDGDLISPPEGGVFATGYNLDYLTIPVMANWHFGNDNAWYLHFGLYYGMLLKAKDTSFGIDMKEDFKSSDVGLAYGIGYKFPLNDKLKLFVQFDGQSGLADISPYPDDLTTARGSLHVGLNFLMD